MDASSETPNVRKALALVGQVVAERYRVEGVLGEGGMGTVLKATHLLLKQPVALKVMTEEAMPDPDLRARFLREARILADLKSPHVASLYDVGVLPDGTLYLAMEYLEGKDLGELVEGPLPAVRAVELGLQVCRGLAEAHDKGIVHRDLKPSNVFVAKGHDGGETVKIIDFGIAKQQKPDAALDRTKTNLMMGSPYFMSPEQIVSSKSVDHRSDIWSFGVLMYQLLSGLLPFYDESVGAILIRVHNQPTPPLPAHVPVELANVVYRCLAKDPAHRYAHIRDVYAALVPFATLPMRAPPSDHVRAVQAVGQHGPVRSPAPLMVPDPELLAALPAHGAVVPVAPLPSAPDMAPDRSSQNALFVGRSGEYLVAPQAPTEMSTDAAVAFAPTLPPPGHPSQKGLWAAVVALGLAVAALAIALFVFRKPTVVVAAPPPPPELVSSTATAPPPPPPPPSATAPAGSSSAEVAPPSPKASSSPSASAARPPSSPPPKPHVPKPAAKDPLAP